MIRLNLAVSVAAYAVAIVLANVLTTRYGLVSVGLGAMATAGTFAAGFALLARDFVHRYGGAWFALAAVAVGVMLSYVLAGDSGHKIALASAVGFGAAEVLDLAVFAPLRSRGFARAAVVSNLVSAPVDTIVFLHLAGFGVTWAALEGQLLGKLVWATLLPIALYLLLAPREAATPA